MNSHDLAGLRREAERRGWTVVQGARHLKWYPPDRSKPFVTTSLTPSDRRALLNIKRDLRRSGL